MVRTKNMESMGSFNNNKATLISFDMPKYNRFNDHDHTEFYPKGHILAELSFSVEFSGNIRKVNGMIVKLNETHFATLYSNIEGFEQCRSRYSTDRSFEAERYEDLTPEVVMITLYCEDSNVNYGHRTLSYSYEDFQDLNHFHSKKFQQYLVEISGDLLTKGF